jgi:transcriptional regulator with XRE-family HTH domain
LPTHSNDRHELAAGLRALRLDAGLSTTEMARRLGWSQSKVSRMERDVTLAKPGEVDAWTRLLHTEPDVRRRLIALAERQGVELLEWKRAMAPGRRRLQEEINTLEASASVIWVFSMDVIPGLAQTKRYAEAMIRLDHSPVPSEEEIIESAEARLARQAILDNPAKRFNLLFAETALRRSLLPREAMQAQIARLVEVARLPNVEMGVIPFAARERSQTFHAFAVLGDPNIDDNAILLAELLTRGLTIRALDEVREYIAHYERLAESALFGDDLLRLLQEISEEAPWS